MDIWGGRKGQTQQLLGSTKEGKHSVCAAECNVRCQDMSIYIYMIEARSTHGSGDSVVESRCGAEGSGTSTVVKRGEELVNYSPGTNTLTSSHVST